MTRFESLFDLALLVLGLVENQKNQKSTKKIGWCVKRYCNDDVTPCFIPFLLFLFFFVLSHFFSLCPFVSVVMASFKSCSLVVGASFFGSVENDALKAV